MNHNLLALDELLRLRTKEVELGSELDVMAVDCYCDLKTNFPFGLALDFVGCVVIWPPRNHVDSFLRSWGWRAQ
ncbi:hypothetical protein F2Q70_00022939 [Brassica cretica]|uniref:Uncharacterized protein n=1 Tax=Brassica cretica TaxID=69181 RepID=A0A8S9GRF1_BRACR|nr:hypothetical protein F2Q70_00022939 [Brassica cretica]